MLPESTLRPALISVDWGSTNFRAFLFAADGELLDSIKSNQGMLALKPGQFETVLFEQIAPWLALGNVPIVMAGMVGSAHGWYDTGYVNCPVGVSDLSRNLCSVPNSQNLNLAIVPGIRGHSLFDQPDVMRGEEVQIFGALALLRRLLPERESLLAEGRALFCLPGTHSKWVRMSSGSPDQVLTFCTQMTGEIYSLLRQHSIVGCDKGFDSGTKEIDMDAFEQGLSCSEEGGLLHNVFSARTLVMHAGLAPDAVASYLSGILLGHEVHDMLRSAQATSLVFLVGNERLNRLYARALERVDVASIAIDGDEAAQEGILSIAREISLINKENRQ